MSLAAQRVDSRADLVERAFAGARKVCGAEGFSARIRVLAAAALFRGQFLPAKPAASLCGLGESQSRISPSRISDAGVTEDMIAAVVLYLREGAEPAPIPDPRAAPAVAVAAERDARTAEAVRLYVEEQLGLKEVGQRLEPPATVSGVVGLLEKAGVARRPRGAWAPGSTAARSQKQAAAGKPARRNPAPVHANASKNTKLRRFGAADVEPERVIDLAAGHAAVVEGRTLFPGSVTASQASVKLLVSGQNNTKLGGEVLKGERTGWPIFHLTLEERATCPKDCAVWAGCYGNAMPFARRHRNDADLMRLIRGEVGAAAKMYPGGFLVRVHTLGDFFSVEYVLMWAELLATTPQLHVFGYTARREDSEDPETRKIAQAIAILTRAMWGRFAIRTSHAEFGPQRSVVVMKDPELPEVIVCPAQKVKTEACATCGLCWSPAARDKTIGFLKHGMKRGGRKPRAAPAPAEPPPAASVEPKATEAEPAPDASAPAPPAPVVEAPQPAPSKPTRVFLQARAPDTRPPNPVTPKKLRFCRWFLAADWRLAEVAHLFDVEPADLREALGATA